MKDVFNFFNQTKELGPRDYVVEAIKYVPAKKTVIDLGAGALRDTRYFLKIGFEEVIAIDKEEIINSFAEELNNIHLKTIISSFEKIDFIQFEKVDLISAQYSLPFMDKKYMPQIIDSIKKALKNKGVFTGTFFGYKDTCYSEKFKMNNFHTEDQIRKMFNNFKIVSLLENERDIEIEDGILHRHSFHLLAIKTYE